MSQNDNPYSASSTPLTTAGTAGTVNIDALDVSDDWKQYFKNIQSLGGLELPVLKAMPKGDQRKEAHKLVKPPMVSFILAFVFGFFYYLAKGMWKKGLVLAIGTFVVLTFISIILYMVGADALASGLRFVGGVVFAFMAPRDFYALKVNGDNGWLPTRPA